MTDDSPLDVGINDYFTHLQVERGLSPNTLAAYRRDISRYKIFVQQQGIQAPQELTPEHPRAFLKALMQADEQGKTLAARSVARIIIAVRGLHKFWALEGTTTTNPAAGLKPPAQGERLPKALTIEQVQQLFGALGQDTPLQLRNRAILEFLYSTGARITETIDLDIDDLDISSHDDLPGVVRVRGKGNKERLVPVGSYAREALEAYLVRGRPELVKHGKGSAAVFLNSRGNRISRQSVWAILKQTAEAANLDVEVSPHTLRHCFATHLIQGGADVRVVQELLGHSSVTTTQVYTKVTAETLKEVYFTAHPRALHSA